MGISLPEPATEPSLWEELGLDGVADVRADITTGDWLQAATGFRALGRLPPRRPAARLGAATSSPPALSRSTSREPSACSISRRRSTPLDATLVITTDKVYDPAQTPPHDESHALGGREPYSASKAAAEIVVAGWPQMRSPRATARAGNVIGGGDWAENRLLPDLVRAWAAGRALGASPPVRRPPLAARPRAAARLPRVRRGARAATAICRRGLNFGPADQQSVSVAELTAFAARRVASAWAATCPSPPGRSP